jgi:adenosylmethionine-8-amino-7-oxononanoate aminotransferase
MSDHEQQPPLEMVRGSGPFVFDAGGRRYIDGISSWWVNLLGHTHPRLTRVLQEQAATLEHVIFAGCTHAPGARLAARLCAAAPGGYAKVFYADCGSAAVKVALKMSFQYWQQTGRPHKRRFVAIGGAYHGETLGALSVGGLALYREKFAPLLLDTINVPGPTCYRCPHGMTRSTCAAECFAPLQAALEAHADALAAVFIEPLVQCANGMNMYSVEYLRKLAAACAAAGVHLVADEIAVGFGRTGTMFACEQAAVRPDFICISKGLTGGYMPFSAVLVRDQQVFDAFYGAYTDFKAFYHSHSYTGNPMACRLALETMDILEQEVLPALPAQIAVLQRVLKPLAELEHVGDARQCGFIGALELVEDCATKRAYALERRIGRQVYRAALRRGALLRPLGDVLYFLPPLTTPAEVLEELGAIARDSIREVTAR